MFGTSFALPAVTKHTVPDKFWEPQFPAVQEITAKYSMLTFNLWWFMIRVFLIVVVSAVKISLCFSDKLNFCISFLWPSSVIYLPLLWWLMLSSLEVNGNRRQSRLYKDPEHNSFSRKGYRVYSAFPPRSYLRSCDCFLFWPYLNSKISIPLAKLDQISLLSGACVLGGMLRHRACLPNAGSNNADVLSCQLVWFTQIRFSDCLRLFRSHQCLNAL